MAAHTQDRTQFTFDSPLGKGVLVEGFSGVEGLSRLFHFKLTLSTSTQEPIAPNQIVGKPVSWSIKHGKSPQRHFSGYVKSLTAGGQSAQGLRFYYAEVVPWLWLLSRASDCRIFQNKTVPDIIKEVFGDFGFSDYKADLKATYRKWEYCVQYRETALNFVSRLLEQAGIFYYFVHEQGKHTLVMADHKGTHKDVADAKVVFGNFGVDLPALISWEHGWEYRTGKWAHSDYNFETPSTPLLANTKTVINLPDVDKYEKFDHPGEYPLKKDGDDEVKVRMEEEEAPHNVIRGESHCMSFTAGGRFTITQCKTPGEGGKSYFLNTVYHSAEHAGENRHVYTNSFTGHPDTVTFRPPRVTPKPEANGAQPAVVVGPKGQELYTDKYGRVKVHFFWDRKSKRDENSSCWIRVAQVMAGKRWGASFWPRIGQEVLVSFLEGDPDRPIIIGSVYNAEQMPPYQGDGPDDKHKSDNKVSGYKSSSTLGGAGFNEWRFDDTKDKEQIFLHAQRDMDQRVKRDSRELVLNDRHLIVGTEKDKKGDQREEVWRDKSLHVHRHQDEWIEGDYKLTVGKGQTGPGNFDFLIEKDCKQTIEGEAHRHVKKDHFELIDGASSTKVSKDVNYKGGANINIEAGQAIHIKAGTTVVIEAGTQISLKVGGNFVDISASGVAINGMPAVLINSGGSAGSGAGCSPKDAKDAVPSKPAKPDLADDAKTGQKSAP
jgi:type VI secretion system secreted protein VgrG